MNNNSHLIWHLVFKGTLFNLENSELYILYFMICFWQRRILDHFLHCNDLRPGFPLTVKTTSWTKWDNCFVTSLVATHLFLMGDNKEKAQFYWFAASMRFYHTWLLRTDLAIYSTVTTDLSRDIALIIKSPKDDHLSTYSAHVKTNFIKFMFEIKGTVHHSSHSLVQQLYKMRPLNVAFKSKSIDFKMMRLSGLLTNPNNVLT